MIPKKTKKLEFGKLFLTILLRIKNKPYKRIFSLGGVGLGEIQLEISANYIVGQQWAALCQLAVGVP